MMLPYNIITVFFLPVIFVLSTSRISREINVGPAFQLGLNLLPPDTNPYKREEKTIYRCKGAPVVGYQYDAPRIQLVEEPNSVGYKVAGPKVVYIDCTTTTRKPNTEKILRYHFNLSYTNYPLNYTTEKYEPVTFRSTPGRRYLPEGPVTSSPFSGFSTGSTMRPISFTTSAEKFTERSTPFKYTDRTKIRPFSFTTPTEKVTERSTPFKYTKGTTKKPFSLPTSSTGFSLTTSANRNSEKTLRPFTEFTTGKTTRKPSTTVKNKLSTSGSGYLPPDGGGFNPIFDSFDY